MKRLTTAVLFSALALTAGCANPADQDTVPGGITSPPGTETAGGEGSPAPEHEAQPPVQETEYPLCAEFPAVAGLPGDVEGWWSSSPADAEGNILADPSAWPDEPREHPRVALVAADTGEVISTWDRVVCGPDPGFVPEPTTDWPAGRVVAVDMDSGEVIQDVGPARHAQ